MELVYKICKIVKEQEIHKNIGCYSRTIYILKDITE